MGVEVKMLHAGMSQKLSKTFVDRRNKITRHFFDK